MRIVLYELMASSFTRPVYQGDTVCFVLGELIYTERQRIFDSPHVMCVSAGPIWFRKLSGTTCICEDKEWLRPMNG